MEEVVKDGLLNAQLMELTFSAEESSFNEHTLS